jgi:peptide/nickel transport system permease protein
VSEQLAVLSDELRTTAVSSVGRRRLSPVLVVSSSLLGLVVLLAIFGSVIAPQHPSAQDLVLGLSKPSGTHWFGTDVLGRDLFSRVIVGARAAVIGPVVISVGAMFLGNLLGLIAGFRGGAFDMVLMRWVDLMWSLPGLLVIVVVGGALGGGYWAAVSLLVVLSAPFDARMVRGATLEQVPRPYVEAAKTLGLSQLRIMVFHIWPNLWPVVVSTTCLQFAASLVALSGLSFLGVGAAPGTPDWGLMVAENQSLLFANPLAVLAPALAIVLTATAMNLLGDWLYERLCGSGMTR